jgi:hypothetical protein
MSIVAVYAAAAAIGEEHASIRIKERRFCMRGG